MFGLVLYTVSSGNPRCECVKELKREKLQPPDVRRYIFGSSEMFSRTANIIEQ